MFHFTQVKKKINGCFSGGQMTKELQELHGANIQVLACHGCHGYYETPVEFLQKFMGFCFTSVHIFTVYFPEIIFSFFSVAQYLIRGSSEDDTVPTNISDTCCSSLFITLPLQLSRIFCCCCFICFFRAFFARCSVKSKGMMVLKLRAAFGLYRESKPCIY